MGALLKAPLEALRPSQHYLIEGFEGTLNLSKLCRETPVSFPVSRGCNHRARVTGKVTLHWKKFCNMNDTLKRVIGILVNWHVSTGIMTRIASYQFTRIPIRGVYNSVKSEGGGAPIKGRGGGQAYIYAFRPSSYILTPMTRLHVSCMLLNWF